MNVAVFLPMHCGGIDCVFHSFVAEMFTQHNRCLTLYYRLLINNMVVITWFLRLTIALTFFKRI